MVMTLTVGTTGFGLSLLCKGKCGGCEICLHLVQALSSFGDCRCSAFHQRLAMRVNWPQHPWGMWCCLKVTEHSPQLDITKGILWKPGCRELQGAWITVFKWERENVTSSKWKCRGEQKQMYSRYQALSFLVFSAFPQTGEEQLPGPGISPPTCLVLELLDSVGCPALSRFTVSDRGC